MGVIWGRLRNQTKEGVNGNQASLEDSDQKRRFKIAPRRPQKKRTGERNILGVHAE
jgi:hypothetical protein